MNAVWLRRTMLVWMCGALLGALAGFVVLVGATRASVGRESEGPGPEWMDATHLPPLLTAPGEHVELRYDVYCGGASETEADAGCDASGNVFVRAGARSAFQEFPLRVDSHAGLGRFAAEVPPVIARERDGFSYYAVFTRAEAPGEELTVPAGGADAPQRSLPLGRSIDVRLGRHVFGQSRHPDARVAEAAWGDGPDQVGLEEGRNLPPIGGSSFDVDASGAVSLLDEAHKRLLRWAGGARVPSRTPLSINGTIADLAVSPDGTAYVLESTGGAPRASMLRAFRRDGGELAAGPTTERASAVRIGPEGEALVQQQPSEQWMQASSDGRLLEASAQRATGRSGRRLPDGSEVVVLRRGNELRLALTGSNGVRRSWRVTSDSPLAEIQFAEPLGDRLVVVARAYSDQQDEFEILVLGAQGLVQSFAVDSADWAEAAPLSRFRLSGSSLFRLGSTPGRVFVDRFDLEVK